MSVCVCVCLCVCVCVCVCVIVCAFMHVLQLVNLRNLQDTGVVNYDDPIWLVVCDLIRHASRNNYACILFVFGFAGC